METQLKELVEIGLTKGESKVYLSLMTLGPTTVGPLVKKSGVAYSKIYDILNRLIKKGLVSFIIKDSKRHFQTASLYTLYDYLEAKEKKLKHQKNFLDTLLPKLKPTQFLIPEQEAEIFVGLSGVKAAYNKLATSTSKGEWIFFYMHQEEYADIADRFYISIQNLLKIPGKMRGITNKEYKKSKSLKLNKKIMKIHIADFPIPGNIDIHNDMVLIQAWSKNPVAFLIKSKYIADLLRNYFENVWNTTRICRS